MARRTTSTAEIAKQIRADLKAATKSGSLPAVTVSVRTSNFAGGSSIRVELTGVPDGFEIANADQVDYRLDHPEGTYWNMPERCRDRYSPEGTALVAKIDAIARAYHEDNSTDDGGDKCWNVNFYLHIDVDSALVAASRERIAARLTAERRAAAAAAKPRVYLRAVAVRLAD